MKSFLTLTLLLSLSLSSQAQDTEPAAYFPDDSTAIAGIRNLSKLYDLEDDHPLKEFGNHPAVGHVFGEFFEGMASDIDEEFYTDLGMTKEDLAKAFPGRIAIGVRIDLTAKADVEVDEGGITEGGSFNFGLNTVSPDIALVADCTLDDDGLASLMKGSIEHENREDEDADPDDPVFKYSLVRESADGLTLFRVEREAEDGQRDPLSMIFTLADGVLVGAPIKATEKGMGKGFFADVVRRVESGGREKGSFASTDGYLDAAEDFEDVDFYFYAPLEKLAAALEKTISDSYEQEAEGGSPLSLFATKDGILNTLGLGDFKAFSLAGTVTPDGFELFNELTFNERRGIIAKILRYDDRGIELPDFAPEGLTAFTITSMDIGGMLTEMLGMVKAISPMASGMLDTQLAMLEKEGLSIKDGLIGSLSVGMASFAGYSSDEVPDDRIPSKFIIMNLSDPAGMERALAGLRAYLGKMGLGESEKREFMGETIYRMDEMAEFLGSMVDLDADATASYAIVGNKLVIAAGELDFMEHGITSLKKKGAALDEDPAVEEAWARWGDKDLVEFAYEDVATFLKSTVLGVEFGTDEFGEDEIVKEALKEAVEGFPSVEDLHFYISSKTFNTPDALTGWTILAKKPK